MPKLDKKLGLWDVYAIATGAMFSSGFFLLPGLATAQSGPSAVLAYLIAGLLMLPAMFSMLELATALPRAGGSYYFVDRSLGPAIGTVTGIGTWLSLILKSAFALIGMGAYLAILPGMGEWLGLGNVGSVWFVKILAVVLTFVFVGINILGAKQSTRLQKLLVIAILAVLGFFLAQGLWYIFARMPSGQLTRQFTPFLHAEKGWYGLFSTVGLVFISYAGLTKISSISEEVCTPERNLPLGMILSIATAMVVYVVGVFIMIAVLDPVALRADLTPVATAASAFNEWLPGTVVVILMVVTALFAFASTGNAGIFSGSRYPLAMARDRLFPERLGKLGRFGTPSAGTLLTGALMILFILVLPTEGVAKLGSAFNLLVFGLINLAVIVMRESRIESYDPGCRVPLYPWLPTAGIIISVWLIAEMGWLTILFSIGVIIAGSVWFARYARPKVERHGAIHHVFARLARYRHPELRTEFREIIKEKGLRAEDPYDQIVQRAEFLEISDDQSFDDALGLAAESLAERIEMKAQEIKKRLMETGRYGGAPISHGAALLHFRALAVKHSEMVLVRSRKGLCVSIPPDDPTQPHMRSCQVYGLFIVVSPEDKTGEHLRILAEIADRAENKSFVDAWRRMDKPDKLKESLLRDSRFMEIFVGEDEETKTLIGKKIRRIDLPEGAFIAMIRRDHESFEPEDNTVLEKGDKLMIIGEPDAIDKLYKRYVES